MCTIYCRHCGATDGFYAQGKISGTAKVVFDSEGNEIKDAGELNWSFDDGSEWLCSNCNKDITVEAGGNYKC